MKKWKGMIKRKILKRCVDFITTIFLEIYCFIFDKCHFSVEDDEGLIEKRCILHKRKDSFGYSGMLRDYDIEYDFEITITNKHSDYFDIKPIKRTEKK